MTKKLKWPWYSIKQNQALKILRSQHTDKELRSLIENKKDRKLIKKYQKLKLENYHEDQMRLRAIRLIALRSLFPKDFERFKKYSYLLDDIKSWIKGYQIKDIQRIFSSDCCIMLCDRIASGKE